MEDWDRRRLDVRGDLAAGMKSASSSERSSIWSRSVLPDIQLFKIFSIWRDIQIGATCYARYLKDDMPGCASGSEQLQDLPFRSRHEARSNVSPCSAETKVATISSSLASCYSTCIRLRYQQNQIQSSNERKAGRTFTRVEPSGTHCLFRWTHSDAHGQD